MIKIPRVVSFCFHYSSPSFFSFSSSFFLSFSYSSSPPPLHYYFTTEALPSFGILLTESSHLYPCPQTYFSLLFLRLYSCYSHILKEQFTGGGEWIWPLFLLHNCKEIVPIEKMPISSLSVISFQLIFQLSYSYCNFNIRRIEGHLFFPLPSQDLEPSIISISHTHCYCKSIEIISEHEILAKQLKLQPRSSSNPS